MVSAIIVQAREGVQNALLSKESSRPEQALLDSRRSRAIAADMQEKFHR
jgi:hypothetical protein